MLFSEEMSRNNRKKILFGSFIFLLLGVGVFLYPVISNYQESRLHEKIIRGYETAVIQADKELMKTEWKKAQEYNQKLRDDYENILNLEGTGVMGYIEIPKIDVRLPIYHGSEEESLKKGVGHIEKTSLPIGGKGTHCVLTGHRGLPSAQLFTRLDELTECDLIYLRMLDETLAYEVDNITVVLPEEVENIRISPEHDYVTLVTCTPYGVNTHRLLVRGRRTEYKEQKMNENVTRDYLAEKKKYILAGFLAGLLILLIGAECYVCKRRKYKRRKCKKR